MNKRFCPADLFLLTASLALLVLIMARGTLALPYISDDFEHGQLIAQIRAGLAPGHALLTRPFHGQTVVLLRLLFWFGTLAGGMSLTWVRLGICAAHVAGAVGCADPVRALDGIKARGLSRRRALRRRAGVHWRTDLVAIQRDFLFGRYFLRLFARRTWSGQDLAVGGCCWRLPRSG